MTSQAAGAHEPLVPIDDARRQAEQPPSPEVGEMISALHDASRAEIYIDDVTNTVRATLTTAVQDMEEEQRRRLTRLLAVEQASKKIDEAIRNHGILPGYHTEQIRRLRDEWPTLSRALDDLQAALRI